MPPRDECVVRGFPRPVHHRARGGKIGRIFSCAHAQLRCLVPSDITTIPDAHTRMLRQVHDVVEPLTRYALETLAIRAGSTFTAVVVATARDSVRFDVETVRGAGKAPASAVKAAGEAAVQSAAGAAMQAATAALPERLARWAPPQPLTAELSTDDAFDGPQAFGTTLTCGSCKGKGAVTCTVCGGRGQDRCRACDGNGNARCGSCTGGRSSCTSCGGQRGRNVQTSDGSFRWEQCWGCGGSGTSSCSQCGGRGTRTCFSCTGGWARCAPCGASGSVACTTCGQSGEVHVVARVRCQVSHEAVLQLQGDDPQLAEEVHALSRTTLAALGTVRGRAPAVRGASVTRTYDVHIPVAELFLPVAGRELRLLGLGRDAEIRDFRNAVGELLALDITTLSVARHEHPWHTLSVMQPLERAIEIVLDSEANRAILATPPGAGATPEKLAQRFHGAVSAAYVARVQREMRGALWRAFAGPLGIPMLGAGLGAALLALPLVLLGTRVDLWSARYQSTLASFALVAIAVLGAEWWGRRRMAPMFDGPSWARITAVLGAMRIAWWLRLSGIALGWIAWLVLARVAKAPW